MTPLRQRFIDDLRLRNYAARTIETYVGAVVRFAKHFGRSPDVLTAEDIRTFQLHLLERRVSWSLFNQTACALRFLYGTTLGRPEQLPFIPYGKRAVGLDSVSPVMSCNVRGLAAVRIASGAWDIYTVSKAPRVTDGTACPPPHY